MKEQSFPVMAYIEHIHYETVQIFSCNETWEKLSSWSERQGIFWIGSVPWHQKATLELAFDEDWKQIKRWFG